MAEIINLRMARKARQRRKLETQARANRAQHGRTGMEKALLNAERLKREALLDGARRNTPLAPENATAVQPAENISLPSSDNSPSDASQAG